MVDSAYLKIDRATKHIADLSKLFSEKNPFSYILETNTQTRQRSTFAKENEAVTLEAAIICGDIIHNLRSALDHAYWVIASHVATNESDKRNIQFPFCKRADRLDEELKRRLAHKVSGSFFKTLLELKPYEEQGGNELLYLIHKLNLLDKHRLLIPTANYTRLSSCIIQSQVPDFPSGMTNCVFGQSHRDVVWNISPHIRLPLNALGNIVVHTTCIFEKKLDVPVDIVFSIAAQSHSYPVIPTLHQIVEKTKTTIDIIRNA